VHVALIPTTLGPMYVSCSCRMQETVFRTSHNDDIRLTPAEIVYYSSPCDNLHCHSKCTLCKSGSWIVHMDLCGFGPTSSARAHGCNHATSRNQLTKTRKLAFIYVSCIRSKPGMEFYEIMKDPSPT
jgi:hypothetical protein